MTTPVPCTRWQSNFVNVYPFSNFNFNMLLAADTVLAYTVPGAVTQRYRVKFVRSSTAEIWVGYNVSPSDPSSNTATTNAYQELVPLEETRSVNGGDTLNFLTHVAARVSVQLLLLQDTTNM